MGKQKERERSLPLTQTHVRIHAWMYLYLHVQSHTLPLTYVRTHTCMDVFSIFMRKHTLTRTYVHTYVRVHGCIYMRAHTHIVAPHSVPSHGLQKRLSDLLAAVSLTHFFLLVNQVSAVDTSMN